MAVEASKTEKKKKREREKRLKKRTEYSRTVGQLQKV